MYFRIAHSKVPKTCSQLIELLKEFYLVHDLTVVKVPPVKVQGVYMVYEKVSDSKNDLNLIVVIVSPSRKNFVPKFSLRYRSSTPWNSWGYFSFMKFIHSQVYIGPHFEFNRTFTIGILLCLSRFTSLSRISIDFSMKFSLSSLWISSKGTINDSSVDPPWPKLNHDL